MSPLSCTLLCVAYLYCVVWSLDLLFTTVNLNTYAVTRRARVILWHPPPDKTSSSLHLPPPPGSRYRSLSCKKLLLKELCSITADHRPHRQHLELLLPEQRWEMSLFYITVLQLWHVEPEICFFLFSLTVQPIILLILTEFKLKSMSAAEDAFTYLEGPFYFNF